MGLGASVSESLSDNPSESANDNTKESAAAREWRLPPLILHPFAPEHGPDRLLQGSKAQLMLNGFLPSGDSDPEELQRLVLAGRYQEIRMLYFLGKDVLRWVDQCADFARRNSELKDLGIREQSFSGLLVESPPKDLRSKLAAWGVSDGRGVFSRAVGLNVLFTAPPPMDLLSTMFLQTYHRFADHLFTCYQNMRPFTMLDPDKFHFEIYASEDYAKMLAEGWG
jgi:hypothetical protein